MNPQVRGSLRSVRSGYARVHPITHRTRHRADSIPFLYEVFRLTFNFPPITVDQERDRFPSVTNEGRPAPAPFPLHLTRVAPAPSRRRLVTPALRHASESPPRHARARERQQAGRRVDAHRRRLAPPRARLAERAARPHALRQDHVDAADGRARPTHLGRGQGGRPRRHRAVGPQARRGDGLPAVHQLPGAVGLREHRLPYAPRRHRCGDARPEGARGGRAPEAHRVPRAHAAEPLGRSAAAHGDRPGAGQGRRAGAARRAAGQPRLQAARGAQGGAAAPVRRDGGDLRLRDHRAAGGAPARRSHPRPCTRGG